MNSTIRKIIASFLTLLLVITAITVFSYFYLHSTIPNYEDNLVCSELNSAVEIFRDSVAVPYIYAATEHDAAFALGFVHAQERLFQMDIMRRAGEGRLSEIMGNKTSAFDKMFRTLGLYKNVSENLANYDTETIEHLEAYAKGINYFIKNNLSNLPIEFSLLGYEPEYWKPEHSLVIGKLFAWELNISWWTDVAFSHLVQKLGSDKVKEILPDFPESGPFIINENLAAQNYSPIELMNVDKKFREFMGFSGTHIGSNNWVVNSEKSVSGKPIIANDPHLAFQIPGKWYVAVIRGGNWNVEGFTLPGVPVVIIGKNQNISWAVTNVMADDADFYFEEFNADSTKYLLDNNWVDLFSRKDTIVVKDSASIVFKIYENHRGPIISEIHPYGVLLPDSNRVIIPTSMRWTALDFTEEFTALLHVNKAANWDDFESALSKFTAPGQNFIYADDKDNIGYICGAKLPIRNNISPTLIYDGRSSANDWKSFVPYNQMPKMFNPANNFIATANNKTDKNFKYHISNLWEPTSRIDRINELLEKKEKHSVDDYRNYQNDFYSNYAKLITPYILNAFKGVISNDENLTLSLKLLRQWDFIMDKRSQTPSIFLTFYQKLLENIFLDEMGETLFKEYVFIANVPYRSVYELLDKNYSVWFDNIETDEIETKNSIIRKSMVDALEELEEKFGDNLSYWQWGEIHQLTFKHMFHGVSSLIDNIVDRGPYSISGDGTTIFNTEYSFAEPYSNTLGPSMRYIFDFANPEEILFVLPNGQSGNPFSSQYSNMTKKWLAKSYYKINLNEEILRNAGFKKILFRPE